MTFGRVRLRIDTPTGGHYKVTHPYGVDEFDVPAGGTKTINFTEDIGLGGSGSPAPWAPGRTRSSAGTPAWSPTVGCPVPG